MRMSYHTTFYLTGPTEHLDHHRVDADREMAQITTGAWLALAQVSTKTSTKTTPAQECVFTALSIHVAYTNTQLCAKFNSSANIHGLLARQTQYTHKPQHVGYTHIGKQKLLSMVGSVYVVAEIR